MTSKYNDKRRLVLAALGGATIVTSLVVACSSDEGGGKGKGKSDAGNGQGGASGVGGTGAPGGGATSSGGASTNGSGGAKPGAGGTSGGGASAAGGTGNPGGGATSSGGTGNAGGAQGDGGAGNTGGTSGGAVACHAAAPVAAPGNACKGSPPPALKLTQIHTGFFKPVVLTYAPGDAGRVYVAQVDGHVKVLNGTDLEADFLDISSITRVGGVAGEQGLLGLAFHPGYATNGRFFVAYNNMTGNGNNTLAEYHAAPGQPPTRVKELFSEVHPSALGNHNGGMVAFGPDGCLYTSLGDGGDGDDPGNRGQDLSEPLASMLRIDVDAPAVAAPGNMTGGGVDPRTWDYGLRNPWRFSFDRATGDLYIGDVGQGAWEEVDVEPAATGHINYGWKIMEGMHCRGNAANCDKSGKRLPAAEQQNGANKAMIGGFVYRGSKIPGMVGRYIYGDHISRKIWSFIYAGEEGGNPKVCDSAELSGVTPGGDITAFGEDSAGELYVLTLNGTVYRIDPA